jgi:hypothetical protein
MTQKLQIPIYPDEQDIGDLITKASVISSLAEIRTSAPFKISEGLEKLIAAERKNFDLHYIHSVLVSSVWNDNDELFLPSELWYSKHTAKDKPFNYEHECDDIIGHMTNGYVVNEDWEKIEDDTKVSDLPELIHIFNQAVLYKHWSKEDKQERMDNIIEELSENKWFVSVECLLPDFDYALKSKSGQIELISRNKKTSFLTKYLRVFNGSGLYDGQRIARVPRNFIISGKGLVKNPANKNSVIVAKKIDYEKLSNSICMNLQSKTSLVYTSNETNNEKVIKMENKELEQSQAEVKKLSEVVQKLQASINESQVEKVKSDLVEAKKELEAKIQEVNVLKASVEKLHAENEQLVKSTDELIKSKQSLEKTLADEAEKAKKEARLVAAKGLGLSAEDASKFVENTDKMADESFNSFVEFQKKFMSTNSVVKTETKVETTGKELENSVNETKVDEPNLVVNVIDKTEEAKKLRQSVAEYISKNHVKQAQPKFGEKKTK